jgi:hypothetical protein
MNEITRRSQAVDLPCILCNRLSRHRGEYSGKPGKLIIYSFCERHDFNDDATLKAVEEQIARALSALLN